MILSIEFDCVHCSKRLRVPDGTAGKSCKCPGCQAKLSIPMVDDVLIVEEELQVQIEIPCPNCQNALLYSPELEGTRGLCKACNHIFTISSDPKVAASSQGTFPFECPKCHHLFEGKDGMQGKRGKCDQCNEVFEIKPKYGASSSASRATGGRHNAGPSQNVVNQNVVKTAPQRPVSQNKQSTRPVSSPTTNSGGTSSVPVVGQTSSNAFAWDSPSVPGGGMPATAGGLPYSQGGEYDVFGTGADVSAGFGAYAPNPYQVTPAVSMGYGTPAGSSGAPGFFESCFKLAHKKIAVVAGMSYLVALLSGGLAILLFVIPAVILGFLAEPLGARQWGIELRIAVALGLYIPGFCVYLFFMPAYWNLALSGVRGKQIEIGALTEYGGMAPLMFVWLMLAWFFPYLLCAGVGILGGQIFGGGMQLILGMLGMLLYFFVSLLVSVPMMLVPFALIDGESLVDAIGLSFKLSYRDFGQYYLLVFLAGCIGLLATVLTCGLGGTFAGAYMLSLQAAYYHRATKRR